MTMSNSQRVGDALQLLSKGLAPFVERELKNAHGAGWVPAVIDLLGLEAREFPLDDVQIQLKVMVKLWPSVFRKVLGPVERALVTELIEDRNDWAHQKTISTERAYRCLDSVQRLLTAVSAEEADELEEGKRELLRILSEELGPSEPVPPTPPPIKVDARARVFSEKSGAGQREEFQAWLRAHREDGFYVNCDGSSMMLHRARCTHLELDGKGSTVRKEKGCSTSLSDLERWAVERGGTLKPCGTCKPRV